MTKKRNKQKYLILHPKHLLSDKRGFVMLIPLVLLFFVLMLMENWMLDVHQQMKFQHWKEKRIQYDMYVTMYVSDAVTNSHELQQGERRRFFKGIGDNEVYIVHEDREKNEKTVIWYINFDGISNQCSFIMEIENGNFIKWKYR